uniref:Uncharacterized protein n=1 Tax=Ignisphaera aggregans TaxID=334771 RepID=A0A7C5TFZ9_9CREN
MSIVKEYYLNEFKKVTIVKTKDDSIIVLVDLYPCNAEIEIHSSSIYVVNMDNIEILVMPLKLEDTQYFNKAEVEILCNNSKKNCQYIGLRLYTSSQILNISEYELFNLLDKIISNFEKCLK